MSFLDDAAEIKSQILAAARRQGYEVKCWECHRKINDSEVDMAIMRESADGNRQFFFTCFNPSSEHSSRLVSLAFRVDRSIVAASKGNNPIDS